MIWWYSLYKKWRFLKMPGKIFVGEKCRNFLQVTKIFPDEKFSLTKIFPDEIFPVKVLIVKFGREILSSVHILHPSPSKKHYICRKSQKYIVYCKDFLIDIYIYKRLNPCQWLLIPFMQSFFSGHIVVINSNYSIQVIKLKHFIKA